MTISIVDWYCCPEEEDAYYSNEEKCIFSTKQKQKKHSRSSLHRVGIIHVGLRISLLCCGCYR